MPNFEALGLKDTLAKEEASRQATAKAVEELARTVAPKQNLADKLGKHIHKVWLKNREDNKNPRRAIMEALRQCRGEYAPEKLAGIRAFKGSEHFIRNAENKSRAADSWIKDIYRGDNVLPWILEPTSVPDLPEETMQTIIRDVEARSAEIIRAIEQDGAVLTQEMISKQLSHYKSLLEDKAVEALTKEAKDRAKRAEKAIRDQNEEGGWNKAFKDFLWYFIRTKAGIIKGPILTKKPKTKWELQEDGTYKYISEDVLITEVYNVSPFNFYPAAGISTVNDGDIIEIQELSKQSISDMIGVPGYSDEKIRAVLLSLASGELKPKWIKIDDEEDIKKVEKDKNAVSLNSSDTELVQAMEFWGSVSGKLLIDWGVEGEVDPAAQYQANCWKIGDFVIKAIINPDELGEKPYFCSSWCKNPAWIWGEGLPDIIKDVEEICNAIVRALVNNVGIASGPQVEQNTDRCEDDTPLHPWKRWKSTNAQMKEAPALNFYSPQMHAGELIQVYAFFSNLLDELSVPAYAQGASQSGVTAGTATVFTQLLAAASRSIKAVVANIDDDIITPYITRCYRHLMKYSDDPAIKGDARIVAKGVAGLLAREQSATRKNEYLATVANPAFMQILGNKNIGHILKEIAQANNIYLPDEDVLDRGGEPMVAPDQNINGQAGNGGTPPKPQELLPNGEPAGGPEFQQVA